MTNKEILDNILDEKFKTQQEKDEALALIGEVATKESLIEIIESFKDAGNRQAFIDAINGGNQEEMNRLTDLENIDAGEIINKKTREILRETLK